MEGAGTPTHKPSFGISATSTVDNRTKKSMTENCMSSDSLFHNSLGLLSCINSETSGIAEENKTEDFIRENLHRNRSLANSVLARASQVCSIPSKLFHPDMPSQTINGLADESTINESDLIKTPQNMSTPKCKKQESRPRMSLLSESISQLSEMLDRNSIDSVMEDFLKRSRETTQTSFIPAENAASKMLADELSWRQKNDIPVTTLQSQLGEVYDTSSASVGDFFKARCDSISDFKTKSPPRHKPVPLIEMSQLTTNLQTGSDTSEKLIEPDIMSKSSFSISTIQQILAQDSPLTAIKKMSSKKIEPQENNTQQKTYDKLSILPSTNTSYSTLFTENHAINAMSSSDKENQPLVNEALGTKSSINITASHVLPSSRSSSCLTSLSNGKLPIHTTKNELIWGCVKIDKCVTKEFLLKNSSSKTIRIQCTLSTYDFKIRKESRSDAELLSTCKFVLHGQESRSFFVSFVPTKVGAAVDELCFLPLDPNLVQTKRQAIRLFGYGGYASAEFQNTTRDNTGKMWLSFGKIDNRLTMEKSICVRNNGNIPLFVYIKVQPKHNLNPDGFKINPAIFVLVPGEDKTVQLGYSPNTKDVKVLKHSLNAIEATDVGKLEIVSGAEVNRARLRRLARKCSEKGLPLNSLTQILSERIPGEVVPIDIKRFLETASALTEILDTFQYHEVVLTVEQDPNQTFIGDITDNSINFQSLCSDETIPIGDVSKVSIKCVQVEPSTIILSPPNKKEDCLYITSNSANSIGFEIEVNPQGLEIFPHKGVVLSGETEIIKIKCKGNVCDQIFKIRVCLENEIHEVDVKIINIRSSSKFFL